MLKSLCIKTKNKFITDYLLKELYQLDIDEMYISECDFKVYKNLIIHYKGKDIDCFIYSIADIISNTIIKFYEESIINNIINRNYFYFTELEQKKILDIAIENLIDTTIDKTIIKKNSIFLSLIDYLYDNKSLVLEGFVNFRVNNYIKIIDSIVDLSVNKYIIDREYLEFIELLRVYINSKESQSTVVHLIYQNQESVLLDEFKQPIKQEDNILNSKFLSDITFSSNDFALNSLLNILPKSIYVHLIDGEDEFINTLKLIFGNRIFTCNDCNICKMYQLSKIHK